MTCFFLAAFSVPFWIPTSYKPYMSEFQPFTEMFEEMRKVNETLYLDSVNKFIAFQEDKYDRIIELECPMVNYVNPDTDNVRGIDLIAVSFVTSTD